MRAWAPRSAPCSAAASSLMRWSCWRNAASTLGSVSTRYSRAERSSNASCANMSCEMRVVRTLSATRCWLVLARRRICTVALRSANSSGPASTTRPSNRKPFNDLGSSQRINIESMSAWIDAYATRRGGCLPRLAQKLRFEGERAFYNAVQIVELRPPAELATDALGARHEHRRIPGTARLLAHRKLLARDALDTRQDLAHAVAVPVAAVEHRRRSPTPEVVERVQVRPRQVLHVDEVAYAGAVGCVVVGAEDR